MSRSLRLAGAGLLAAVGILIIGADRTDAGGASVAIVDFAFQPGGVEVPVGGTVSWSNNGETDHTVTADGGSFSSGTLSPGSGFSATFSTPGAFSYSCTIHPEMTGSVTVTSPAPAPAPEPGTDGSASTDTGSGSGTGSTTPVGAAPTATG